VAAGNAFRRAARGDRGGAAEPPAADDRGPAARALKPAGGDQTGARGALAITLRMAMIRLANRGCTMRCLVGTDGSSAPG
jgi:hypothetical protein